MDTIWETISIALELSPEISEKWLAKLRKQFSQSHRHYHNEDELIRRKLPHLTGASVCLQLASLFQYYHFEADKDCVSQNCEVVTEFFTDAKPDNKTLEANVKRLLGEVQIDVSDLSEDDVHFFQDLDLLILGTSPDEYKQYTEQLRNECSSEDVRSYDKTRLKLLLTISRIPYIYNTKEFSERYESVARDNIAQEVQYLQGK